MMDFLQVRGGYNDPAAQPYEEVENKGPGHPDSLADALAHYMSVAYSKWCLANFGAVLHHNLDKVYIGAGWYTNGFGYVKRHQPIRVVTNGRISGSFAGEPIPYQALLEEVARDYLKAVLPHAQDSDVAVTVNATQHTMVPRWFSPASLDDVPDATNPRANDTSLTIGHWGATPTELLVDRLGRYFWRNIGGFAVPRFPDIGQDIKVMAVRTDNHVNVTVRMPAISTATTSHEDYLAKVAYHEAELRQVAKAISAEYGLEIRVDVNTHHQQGHRDRYMLGIGTCAECGEEGVVGRGNTYNGLISAMRVHSAEAPWGKNPRYHTGRVMTHLSHQLAGRIGQALGSKCTVAISTRCGDSLFPPARVQVWLNSGANDTATIEQIVRETLLDRDPLSDILAFRPWVETLA